MRTNKKIPQNSVTYIRFMMCRDQCSSSHHGTSADTELKHSRWSRAQKSAVFMCLISVITNIRFLLCSVCFKTITAKIHRMKSSKKTYQEILNTKDDFQNKSPIWITISQRLYTWVSGPPGSVEGGSWEIFNFERVYHNTCLISPPSGYMLLSLLNERVTGWHGNSNGRESFFISHRGRTMF